MKVITLFFSVLLVYLTAGCAIAPPIDQQTLETQKEDQAAQKSDEFGSALPQ